MRGLAPTGHAREVLVTGPRRRTALLLVWTWRVWMLLYLSSAVAQPVLAGAYLQGDYDAIGLHGTNGAALLSLMVLGSGVLSLACAVTARAAWWPVAMVVALFVAQGIQIGMGYSRSLLVHVPLGVGIVVTVAGLTLWVWSPRLPAGRRRRS